MKIKTMLDLLGDASLLTVKPEGYLILDTLHRYTPNRYDISAFTGNSIRVVIEQLPANERETVYETELNDGIDFTTMRAELQSVVDGNSKGNVSRSVITGIMAFLVFLCTLVYLWSMAWVCYHQKTLPSWQEIALPFGVPGMVIWKYFGVINKERSELLLAALGKTPVVNNPITELIMTKKRND